MNLPAEGLSDCWLWEKEYEKQNICKLAFASICWWNFFNYSCHKLKQVTNEWSN